jgi:hypothetical protein
MFYPQMTQMYADKCRAAPEGRRAIGMSFMARDLETMFRGALDLSEGDRATLAGLLIEAWIAPTGGPVWRRTWSTAITRPLSWRT